MDQPRFARGLICAKSRFFYGFVEQPEMRITALVGILIYVSAQGAAAEATCRDFKRLLTNKSPAGISKKFLYGDHEAGYEFYRDLDLDGDGKIDKVSRSCSASVIPADPCYLEVALSSGDTYDFTAWRMYLVSLNGRTYVISSDLETQGRRAPRSVHLLAASGAHRVCSGL